MSSETWVRFSHVILVIINFENYVFSDKISNCNEWLKHDNCDSYTMLNFPSKLPVWLIPFLMGCNNSIYFGKVF